MDQYLVVAREYFRAFEGLRLYRDVRMRDWWVATVSALAFVGFLWFYAKNSFSGSGIDWWSLALAVVAEFALLWALSSIRSTKEERSLEIANTRAGSAFNSLQDCRRSHLCHLLGVKATQFLEVAEEIVRLRQLDHSVLPQSELVMRSKWRVLFDPAAKDRVANWALAFCSALLAVAITGDSKLDNIFEAMDDTSFRRLVAVLGMVAALVVFAWFGVRAIAATVQEVLTLWMCRVSTSRRGTTHELNYLLRDLVKLHRRKPLERLESAEGALPTASDSTCRPEGVDEGGIRPAREEHFARNAQLG